MILVGLHFQCRRWDSGPSFARLLDPIKHHCSVEKVEIQQPSSWEEVGRSMGGAHTVVCSGMQGLHFFLANSSMQRCYQLTSILSSFTSSQTSSLQFRSAVMCTTMDTGRWRLGVCDVTLKQGRWRARGPVYWLPVPSWRSCQGLWPKSVSSERQYILTSTRMHFISNLHASYTCNA